MNNKIIPVTPINGEWICPEPHCGRKFPSNAAYTMHYARSHAKIIRTPTRAQLDRKRKLQIAKARKTYNKKSHHKKEQVQHELDYLCPVCGTPQAPIAHGIKEAIAQRLCREKLTQS